MGTHSFMCEIKVEALHEIISEKFLMCEWKSLDLNYYCYTRLQPS